MEVHNVFKNQITDIIVEIRDTKRNFTWFIAIRKSNNHLISIGPKLDIKKFNSSNHEYRDQIISLALKNSN